MSKSKEEQQEAYAVKNARRQEFAKAQGGGQAKLLRSLGLVKKVKESTPTDVGDDIVTEYELSGVPGAFGWGTKQEWNDRVIGTSGQEK